MSTIIDTFMDIFIKQKRKLSQVMIIVFIFTILFPSEAVEVKDILIAKIHIISPISLKNFFAKLQFSQKEFLTIWTFLLAIYALVAILDILKQLLNGKSDIIIASIGQTLFEINSIIFLSVLIYNTLNYPGIKISSLSLSASYYLLLVISGLLFMLVFCSIYCYDIILIHRKINSSDSSKKQPFTFILNGIYFIIILYICTKISHILFR